MLEIKVNWHDKEGRMIESLKNRTLKCDHIPQVGDRVCVDDEARGYIFEVSKREFIDFHHDHESIPKQNSFSIICKEVILKPRKESATGSSHPLRNLIGVARQT